jgi:hypothetical protein
MSQSKRATRSSLTVASLAQYVIQIYPLILNAGLTNDVQTHVIACDALVDGICRKTNSYIAQSVRIQKNKKLDFDTFLYKTPNGVIDTEMAVASYSGQTDLDKAAPETVGTLELRLSITRQFGVEHDIDETKKYDKVKVGADASTQTAFYKDVPPQFHMIFEENSPTLEGLSGSREKGKMNKKRPGTQPWAIFRFHYRTEGKLTNWGEQQG